jgi:hypothetical protein
LVITGEAAHHIFHHCYVDKILFRTALDHAALTQFSQEPYFELKVPPPLCCACSEITAWAQTSQVLAMSPSDMGCERLRREMLNLNLAFIDKSSYSLLLKR